MAAEVDPLVGGVLAQAFSENSRVLSQLGTQFLQTANFVNQQVQLSHQRSTGMFEAKALNNLEQEGIADAILQARGARDQPDFQPK